MLAYTVIAGFLAVSLTDFVQGSIMFIALIFVPVAALFVIGGFTALEPASPQPLQGCKPTAARGQTGVHFSAG